MTEYKNGPGRMPSGTATNTHEDRRLKPIKSDIGGGSPIVPRSKCPRLRKLSSRRCQDPTTFPLMPLRIEIALLKRCLTESAPASMLSRNHTARKNRTAAAERVARAAVLEGWDDDRAVRLLVERHAAWSPRTHRFTVDHARDAMAMARDPDMWGGA
ncbi:hypothetical protein [Solilutibacter silvestris]|uniref:hypothetical protein n=1 Tax=Solilutibacter silvestris TaxID=1645665 RepID=UPI00101AD365|nr:hypothetical protein [Lysobacter silvestris]